MNAIDRYFEKLAAPQAALLHFLRSTILAADKEFTERIAYGLPFIYKKKGICYFNAKKNGIDVCFMYGAYLPQRDIFISEKRKLVRSVFYKLYEEVDTAPLLEIVQDAIAFDAQYGRGGQRLNAIAKPR